MCLHRLMRTLVSANEKNGLPWKFSLMGVQYIRSIFIAHELWHVMTKKKYLFSLL